jgi:hypothetical protein
MSDVEQKEKVISSKVLGNMAIMAEAYAKSSGMEVKIEVVRFGLLISTVAQRQSRTYLMMWEHFETMKKPLSSLQRELEFQRNRVMFDLSQERDRANALQH